MKRNGTNSLIWGSTLLIAFAAWTILIQTVDVQPIGANGTDVGFAGINGLFHRLTGVHMTLYTISDWLGFVPLFVCMAFGTLGLVQLINRRSLLRVDCDLLLLGVHYILTILAYLAFEMFPVNFRPVLIGGALEASYPSSTTLLVLGVMPTLVFQVQRRCANTSVRNCVRILSAVFCALMVAMRTLSGVHWLTDIAGGALLSAGLFHLYRAAVLLFLNKP